MKQTGAVIFLFISLMANTALHQVFRLPILFAHYQEHRQAIPHTSFVEFMTLHYLHGDVHDADYERDRQLPFKDHTWMVLAFPVAVLPDDVPEPAPPAYRPLKNEAAYQSPFASFSILFAIWQPPRA